MMTPLERLEAVISRREVDKVPVMFFSVTIGAKEAGISVSEYARNADALARGQLAFLKKYNPDAIIAFSDVCSVAEAFGTKTKFYNRGDSTPVTTEFVIKKPEDWEKIDIVEPNQDGRIPIILGATKLISDKVGDMVPVVGFVFSPLTVSSWIAELATVVKDVKRNLELLKKGLDKITASMVELGKALIESGASALFFVATRATKDIFTAKQYEEFGIPYDMKVLEHLKKTCLPIAAHVCGIDPMLELLIDKYPIIGIN